MQVKRIVLITFILSLFLLKPLSVLAVTVTVTDPPSQVDDQPFNLQVSITGASSGTNYLRANFYPLGTTQYFGYTFNGNSFYKESDVLNYYPITIDSTGNWSGTLQAKVDTSSSSYNGPGSYGLKVRRYTSSGSSYIWSNDLNVSVVSVQSSTPSPSPQITATPNPSTTTSSQFLITNVPSSIGSDDEFEVDVTLNLPNNPNSQFFLKGAFLEQSSSNYFGLTKVSDSWIKNGSEYSTQYKIQTDASGNFKGKIKLKADIEDSGFKGSGSYIVKVGRYNSSGSGPSWSNEQSLNIKYTSTPSPNASTTVKASSNTSTTSSLVKSSSQNSDDSNLDVKIPDLGSNSDSSVAGEIDSQETEVMGQQSRNKNWLFIMLGIITLSISLAIVVKLYKKRYHP